jgi:hypothetical protein
MRKDFDSAIQAKDWLAHRWDFRIYNIGLIACREPWHVEAGSCTLSTHATRRNAERWVERLEPRSLADVAAAHADLLPLVVVIDAAGERLARIPEPLWRTYDAIDMTWNGRLAALSAKARAMFPGMSGVFIHGYPPGHPDLRPKQPLKPRRIRVG